ncbi:MAG: hypothetical protein U1E42_07895 [Rhodospirillales bacterium]
MKDDDEFNKRPKTASDNKLRDELQERLKEAVRNAWPEPNLDRVESETRIISNLAWAAETLLASAPNMHRDLLVERVGDVMRVVRERANALGRAVKNPE